MKKYKIYFVITIIILILSFTWCSGYRTYPKWKPCPTITHDTTYIYDTITYHIVDTFPFYIAGKDSIIYRDTGSYHVVDTAEILKLYYALHIYNREWKDTNLIVNIKDFITENKSINNEFNYKILRPQTIINNTIDKTTTYYKYVQVGLTVPLKSVNLMTLDAHYIFPKGYIGGSYGIKENTFSISGGLTLFQLKKYTK